MFNSPQIPQHDKCSIYPTQPNSVPGFIKRETDPRKTQQNASAIGIAYLKLQLLSSLMQDRQAAAGRSIRLRKRLFANSFTFTYPSVEFIHRKDPPAADGETVIYPHHEETRNGD